MYRGDVITNIKILMVTAEESTIKTEIKRDTNIEGLIWGQKIINV